MQNTGEQLLEEVGENIQELKPNVLWETVQSWIPGLVAIGIKILIALIIFVIGRKVIKSVQKMIRRSFERAGMEVGVMKFLHSLIGFFLNAILIFIIAGQIGIDSASIVAVLGSAGLALGLALQGSLTNLAGGILILLMKPYLVGDYIVSPMAEGTVSMIGLVYTTLITADNRSVTIPNGVLSNSTVTNVTAMDKRRVDLSVGIGYASDLKRAKEILEQIYRSDERILKEEPITVFVDNLADSAVMLGVRGWVGASDYWQTKWDLTERVKLAFDDAGIEIPFNQMDVHIIQDQPGNGQIK